MTSVTSHGYSRKAASGAIICRQCWCLLIRAVRVLKLWMPGWSPHPWRDWPHFSQVALSSSVIFSRTGAWEMFVELNYLCGKSNYIAEWQTCAKDVTEECQGCLQLEITEDTGSLLWNDSHIIILLKLDSPHVQLCLQDFIESSRNVLHTVYTLLSRELRKANSGVPIDRWRWRHSGCILESWNQQ